MADHATMGLKDLAKEMADIDFSMLTTRAQDGTVSGRPMSNNGDVEYDGDSVYFAWERSGAVRDIAADARVGLGLQGRKGLLGKPPLFVSVEGRAELVRDKAAFAAHWHASLDRWFTEGIDTPGVVMIKVHATRIRYWDGEEHGDISP